MIYFDNAASARPLPEVIETASSLLSRNYANPNALHRGGIESEAAITGARNAVAEKIGLSGDIIFTSGATESNNLAIFGVTGKIRGKKRIITTAIEHPSVSVTLSKLDNYESYEIIRVKPSELDNIADYADENTALVSVNAVCSETGFVSGVNGLYKRVKRGYPDIIFHTDGSQGFLKTGLDGDLISLSAHKIGGVCGAGALFVKSGVKLNPLLYGGGQQKGLRAGTQPAALIGAFAKAAEIGAFDAKPLRERLISGLSELTDIKINSPENSVSNIVNFSVCGVKSEVMLNYLSGKEVYVSAGSACSRGKRSVILPEYGISDIDSALRVSFGKLNTTNEIDEFLNILSDGIKKLRGKHGNYNGKIR